MKVLVSGSHGFLGSRFVAYLKKKKISYIAYDRKHPERTPSTYTHAVHFGGLTPHSTTAHQAVAADYLRANVEGTKRFLKVIAENKNLKKLVNIGTAAEYRRSAYGTSKRAQSRLVRAFARRHRVKTVNLHIFNVAGLPRTGSVFRSLMTQLAKKNSSIILVSNAASTRDFVDIDDLMHAVYRALTMKQGELYEAMDIASGQAISLRTLVMLFASRMGKPVSIKNTSPRSDHSVGDPRKARQLLGWRARTPLEQSIRKMVP